MTTRGSYTEMPTSDVFAVFCTIFFFFNGEWKFYITTHYLCYENYGQSFWMIMLKKG